jgi:hypothetical protein
MNLARTTRTLFGAAIALAAVCIVAAPSVASRRDVAPSTVTHRFVPTTVQIAVRDEEAAPTF